MWEGVRCVGRSAVCEKVRCVRSEVCGKGGGVWWEG